METLTVDLPPGVAPERARLLLAVRLLEEGDVSLGYAAEMAELPLRAFVDALAHRGIAVLDHPAADLEAELTALRRLSPPDARG